MDDGLKQRLIGAVVLIAIAILFVPSLFNQGGRKAIDLTTQVPPEPESITEPLEIPIPAPPESARPGKPLAENYDHSTTVSERSAPEAPEPVEDSVSEAGTASAAPKPPEVKPDVAKDLPVLNAEGVPRAWSIQVASFSEKSRADAMIKKLADEGFERSYVRSASSANGELYRVFVGPKINRADAESDQAKLNAALKVKSLLVEFKP